MNSFHLRRIDFTHYSDTFSSTLIHIFYQLARNPEHIPKLREEIALHVNPSEEIIDQKLQNAEHLNGVIFEALRLHPPVPTAIPRLTPPEGLQIGQTYIPGNVTVWCSQYAIGRSTFAQLAFFQSIISIPTDRMKPLVGERVYQNASSFIPERWYPDSKMIYERSAFAPFSIGEFVQPIALILETRYLTSSYLLTSSPLPSNIKTSLT